MPVLEISQRERIIAAALENKGLVFSQPMPSRHHDIIYSIDRAGLDAVQMRQGFLTNRGRFVNREIALEIALRAEQLGPKKEGNHAIALAQVRLDGFG